MEELGPNLIELGSDLIGAGQIWPTSVQFLVDTSHIWSTLREVGPKLDKCVPTCVEHGPNLTEVGETRSNFVHLSELDTNSARISSNFVEAGTVSKTFG